jgi:apolipoprotein N-acyltransferase
LAFWLGTCYWIHFVLARHGGLTPVLAWVAVILFALIKGLHLAAFSLLAGVIMLRAWAVLAVPALWVVIERTHGPLGFAWLALGNAGISMGIPIRLAPYAGVYGLSFLFAAFGTALAVAALRRPRRHLAVLLPLGLIYLLPRMPDPQRADRTALLVQPNISQDADWTEPWVKRMHNRLALLSLAASTEAGLPAPELIVWPEVPLPVYYDRNVQFRDLVSGVARRTGSHLLLNVVAHTPEHKPLNSALLVGPDARPLGRYDKLILVPLGEYVPAPLGFMSNVSSELGDFVPGRDLKLLRAGDRPIGAFICYEAASPDLVRRFAANGAQLLVNISNDGWFGPTAARHQHLMIARMRAAENRRWLLRATNDGLTATIDPAGRAYQPMSPYVEAAAHTTFAYIDTPTFYTRFGDWFVWLCAGVAAVGLLPWSRLEPGASDS